MLGVAFDSECIKSLPNDMPSSKPDDSLLLIRCPSCGQRFKVGEDLRARTVECGGCEHRFRIDDDVIVRGRKIYPGERKDPGLNRFQRVPLPGGESMIGVQPVRYGNLPDPAVLEPASPQRIMAGAIGVAGMILMALLLMFGASRGGLLDGMVLGNRLMMAGFAALMGILFLVYANPRARLKAVAVGLTMGLGLLAIPFFFKAGSVPLADLPGESSRTDVTSAGDEPEETAEDAALAALKAQIGVGPLEDEIEKAAGNGNGENVWGIWLRGLLGRNKFLVKDYFLRVTDADRTTHFYPRDNDDYLLVVTGTTISLQELAKLAAEVGVVENSYPELSLIEVRVSNGNFVEGAIEKLTDKKDPAFYDLNKRELESIDLERVKRAVSRLAGAAPEIYRSDITRKMIELLGQEGVDFKDSLSQALAVWSEQPGPAGEAALQEVKKLVANKKPVPQEMIALIVKEQNAGVVPYLDELWREDPVKWERHYGDLGPAAEAAIIDGFARTEGSLRHSAVRILERAGGADSLPVLEAAAEGADTELEVLIAKARKAIEERPAR